MLAKIHSALIITRRELNDQVHDWRILVPIFLLTIFFPGLLNTASKQATKFLGGFGANIASSSMIPFLLMIVGFFPITVSLAIALESFVGEKERRSLEPLIASPLNDWQLYLGKLLAALVIPLVASYLGTAVYLIGVHNDIGCVPSKSLLIQLALLMAVEVLVMVSAATVISTQVASVKAANLMAGFIVIPMAFIIQGESLIIFWGRNDTLWWVILGEVVIASLLMRMGISHFNREELLGRDTDTINVRWIGREFKKAFIGQAKSPREWFFKEIPKTLKRMKIPIVIMEVLLGSALIIGASEAKVFTMPPELFNQEAMSQNFQQGFQTMPLFSPDHIHILWFHNVRAFVMATILGIFSFGVLGLLVLMLPMLIVGYFLGAAAAAGFSPWQFAAGFVLPHGILEIPAILLVGAAILRLGGTLTAPFRGKSIGAAMVISLADWARIMLVLVIPLLLGAAVLEVLLTPRMALLMLNL